MSRLQKKNSPGFAHDGLPICAWKHALAPQTRACLRHVIVNNVLVNADTWQASACHCEPRPRTRARLPAFCMSLRTSVHTGVAIRFPRREAWQVGCCLGKFVALSRIRLRCCFLLCATAGVTDCHVASLLAMTVGEMSPHPSALPLLTPGMFLRTLRAKRSCTRRRVTAFSMSLRTPSLHPRTPARFLHVIASQCAHWCGNPFSPQRSLASGLLFGQIRGAFPYSP